MPSRRLLSAAALSLVAAIALVAPRAVSAQGSPAVLRDFGASPLATDITFPVSKTLPYRLAWGITDAHARPDSVVPGFRNPANFLYVANANGIPRENIHLAIVIWGTATHSLLRNDAYKAVKGTDNASLPILQALHDAGVEIIVCGEALINRKIDRKDVLPFVKIAPTAMLGLATLAAQGYTTWMP